VNPAHPQPWITSQPQRAGFPLTSELQKPLLSKQAWIKISQVSAEDMDRIVDGLNEIIG